MLDVLSAIQIIGVAIGFLSVFSIMSQKQTDYRAMLLMAEVCCITAMLGYLFTLRSEELREMLVANKFGYFGKCFANTFSMMFITRYYKVRVPKFVFPSFFLFDVIAFVLIMTSEFHSLYYSYTKLVYNGHFYVAETGKTPFYWLYMLVMLALMIWFEAVCIRHWKEEKKQGRVLLSISLILAGLIPFVMLLLFLAGVTYGYDTTPLGILLSCSMIVLAVRRFGLFDTVQIAKENVVENIREGIFVIDTDYQLLYENQSGAQLLEEGGDREKTLHLIFENRDNIIQIEEKSFEVRVADIMDGNMIRGYMAWIFDVTLLQKHTQQILELKEAAERAAKVKSDFLANMSHEIRTPMNAITGMTEMILRGRLDEEQKEYAYQIKNASSSLLTIINDILDFSKIESGKMEIVEDEYELMSLLDDVGSIVKTRIGEKELKYIVHINQEIPHRLYGDDNRIKQMIINLANNAVKFTEEGAVTLSVDFEKEEEQILLTVKVKDTGIGIKKEDMEKIFESFAQADSHRNRSIEGTGLGLAITKNLAELMHGTIQVRSVYNVGSEFSFTVPQRVIDWTPCASVDYKSIREREHENYPHFTASQANVLVVDDNRVNLLVAEGLMQPFQIQVTLADSGKKALQLIKEYSYDLVFMDHIMPEMDGIETTKAIRKMPGEYYQKLPIVAFSANAVNNARELLLTGGMNDFVAKPVEVGELTRALLTWLPEEKVIREPAETDNG